MVRPTRASCIGISQQWRASFADGNSVSPAQVTLTKVEDESMNLTALADRQEFGVGLPAAECLLGSAFEGEKRMCPPGTEQTILSVQLMDPKRRSVRHGG